MRSVSLALICLSVAAFSVGTTSFAQSKKSQPKKPPAVSKKTTLRAKVIKPSTPKPPVTTTGATRKLAADTTIDQRVIDLDVTPPDLSITSHAGLRMECDKPSITLSGVASDDLKIANVKWYTTRGASGDCVGIENWSANNIPLQSGENLITIAATDVAGNIGADCITVLRSDKVLIQVVVPSTNIPPNKDIEITVNYTNPSDTDVFDFILSAPVPDEMNYVAGSAEASGGSWNPATRRVTWILATLGAHQSGAKVFKARVK